MRQLKASQGGKPKGRQAGETGRADSEAAPEAQDSRATWKTGTGRRRKRMRKMRGSPQVPFEAEPAESDPGRPGDRAEGKTRKAIRRREPRGITSRSRRIHTAAQAAGESSAIPRGPSVGKPANGPSAPPKGCRAGKPVHGVAGKAGLVKHRRGNSRAWSKRFAGAARSGETRSKPAACRAGETVAGATRSPTHRRSPWTGARSNPRQPSPARFRRTGSGETRGPAQAKPEDAAQRGATRQRRHRQG